MRHRNKKHIVNRPSDQRKALVRSLITALFTSAAIVTTQAKAKAFVPEMEKLITVVKGKLAKNEIQNAIRALKAVLYTEESSRNALEYIKNTPKNSGFIRVVKKGYRAGDNALEVAVQLIAEEEK